MAGADAERLVRLISALAASATAADVEALNPLETSKMLHSLETLGEAVVRRLEEQAEIVSDLVGR